MIYGSVCSGIEAASVKWTALGWHRDLTGHRNGLLTVIKPVGKSADGHILWHCRCDCGGEKVVQSNNLTREAGTRSCGCLRCNAAAKRLKRDGVWNDGKNYAIGNGEHCYKTRHSWAKAAIRHYGRACMQCGWNESRCDVHHRMPKSQGGLHTIANALVLCPNCHRIEHEKGGK